MELLYFTLFHPFTATSLSMAVHFLELVQSDAVGSSKKDYFLVKLNCFFNFLNRPDCFEGVLCLNFLCPPKNSRKCRYKCP
jgi:hypothetical protein